MSEWQPILSAPRDGTPVLLWAEAWDMTWGIQIGQSNGSGWQTSEGSVPDNDEDFDPAADIDKDEEFDEDANLGPTHWMALPAPPALALPARKGTLNEAISQSHYRLART